eukprot:6355190-Alexandrium_andersonii.AAC.1
MQVVALEIAGPRDAGRGRMQAMGGCESGGHGLGQVPRPRTWALQVAGLLAALPPAARRGRRGLGLWGPAML